MNKNQPFTLKIFFRYFPKGLWIGIAIASLFKILVPDSENFPFVIVNVLLFFLFLKLMIIIHECGHLLAGYWVGATPKRMILGSGHEIYRTQVRGLKIIVNSVPLSGLAIAFFERVPFLRWRNAFFVLGGPLSNLLVIVLIYILFGFDDSFLSGANGFSPASAMIIANGIGVLNLIPFSTSRYGTRLSSDGLLLIKTLFKSYKTELNALKNMELYFEGLEQYESKNFEKARNIYESILQSKPDDFASLSMIALIDLKELRLTEALTIAKILEAKVNTKEFSRFKGIIYNNIAFAYLLINEIESASQYIDIAFKLAQHSHYVIGTYGCIQVEKGNLDVGISWLIKNTDMDHPGETTLTASIYLMLAYHLKGDIKSREKHLAFVRGNENQLDHDTRILMQRNLQKMELEIR